MFAHLSDFGEAKTLKKFCCRREQEPSLRHAPVCGLADGLDNAPPASEPGGLSLTVVLVRPQPRSQCDLHLPRGPPGPSRCRQQVVAVRDGRPNFDSPDSCQLDGCTKL